MRSSTAGAHALTIDRFDTPYVALAARTFVDASDPADVAAANAIQDSLRIEAASARPFEPTEYDVASLDTVRAELLGSRQERARHAGDVWTA